MKKIIAVLLALVVNAALAQTFPVNNLQVNGNIVGSGGNTAATALWGFTAPATNQFYQNSGASVTRIQDRLFVGPAALNNATNVASQPDWLTTYQIAKGRTYGYVQTSQLSVLNGLASQDSLTTLVVGAQTSGRSASASQVLAITGIGVNNDSGNTGSSTNQAWGGYFEGFRDTGSAGNGGAYGIEIDTMNFTGSAAVTDPYSQSGDQTVSAQLASGGGFSGTLYPTTVGLNFQNNNATFDKGIVFGSNSLTGDNGSSGSGIAIAMGFGHMLQWYGAAATATSSIIGDGTTAAGAIQQVFTNNNVQWNNASSGPLFLLTGVGSSANYLQVQNAATTNAPTIAAQGTDTNIFVAIAGKGTGAVNLTGGTSAAAVGASVVGEDLTANTAGTSMSTGVSANCTTKTLTPGYWLVWGVIDFVPAGTTTIQNLYSSISTTSATLPAGSSQITSIIASYTTGNQQILPTPLVVLNVSSSTPVYLVGNAAFGVSTMTCTGTITAIRYH